MGKVSIIVVLIFIGIVTIISLTVFNSSSKVADLLATEETSDNLKNLGNYALNYAIKQVKNENVNQSTTQTFNDFQVLNGEINSIDYVFNAPKDSVKIFANVSWNGPYEVKQHQSQAWLKLTNIGGGSGSGNNVEPFELEEEKTNQYNVPPRSAFWKFNEDGGNTAYDSVSDNDGELIDGSYWNGYSLPQWVTGRTGKEGSALQFNGWDNYVHISDADSLDLTEEGTISAWIHINNYTNWAGFVHKGDSSDWYDEAYSLQTDYNGDKIVFIINNESGYDLWLYGNTALEKNTWYHLVATFNNEKLAIYIDGVLDEEINNTIGNVRNTNGGLNIGAQTNQYSYSYGNFSLDGIIDQVSIWKKFVNSSKAKKIYLQELASAYLPLNEESGDIAYDFSGADNHANLSGGLQNNWDEGIIEGGLHFISGSNRLQIHSAPNLTGMNKLSIFSWVKFDEFSNNLTDIVNKNSQYILRLQDSNDAYKPSGIIYADGNSHEVSSNYEINMLDRWYNIASIYDNKRMKIYVDNTDKSPNNNNINRDIDNTNNSIFIGSSSTSNQIKGSLDEVMIFNQEITDENLATLYKVDRIKELRGRWPLNEASGEIAYDTSKYSNNGELQNAWNAQTLPEWIEGKFHGALRFTGAGEFVGAEQNLVTQYPFSLAAWVRTSNIQEERVIYSLGNNEKNRSKWGIYIDAQGRACLKTQYQNSSSDINSYTNIADGKWHFVVGVFESETSRSIFVDGELKAAASTSVEYDTNVNNWSIGRWSDKLSGSYFKGDIDHVRIWNRALTNDEVIYLNTDPYYDTELMAYWDMNQTSGTQVYDNSEYQHTGELQNSDGTNSWVEGCSENSLQLDGYNDYVIIPDDDNLDGINKLSISFWVYPTNLDQSPRAVISKRRGYNNEQSYTLYFDHHGWRKKLYVAIDNSDDRFSTEINFENNRWYYIVVTYDGEVAETERVKVYVNGELDTTAYESSNSIPNYDSDLYLGVLDQYYNSTLGGKLDEVKIYKRVLSETEVENNFFGQSGFDLDNLISYWNLDENEGSIAHDIQDGNDGDIYENPNWTDGILSSALSLDGTNDYIDIGNKMNLDLTESITLEVWANTSQKNRNAKLVEKGDWDGYGIGQDRWQGWQCHIRTSDWNYHVLNWGEGKPHHHIWYHLAMTYDGEVMKFYVDGEMKDEKTINSSIITNDRNFTIGSNEGAQKFFKGKVDEIRVWNTALTELDIQILYNNGSPIVPEPGGGGETEFKIVYWSE